MRYPVFIQRHDRGLRPAQFHSLQISESCLQDDDLVLPVPIVVQPALRVLDDLLEHTDQLTLDRELHENMNDSMSLISV